MSIWLNAGLIFTLAGVLIFLVRWGNLTCVGSNPLSHISFLAILFTSGLDVGLIMFPLTEFPVYADIVANPEYAFSNPLAIEFGFWAFWVWSLYFFTCFYFCVIEPKVGFFEVPVVRWVNNIVIIGTCAFTASLFLGNLPWYLAKFGDGESTQPWFYALTFLVIACAVHSSSKLRYVRVLSISSTVCFIALIAYIGFEFLITPDNKATITTLVHNFGLIGSYFENLNRFVLPINAYHEFYLYWWFAWSIMIGQFTARFVGGFKVWQLFLAMLLVPSILIGSWFTVLYSLFENGDDLSKLASLAMVSVGLLFVINSLDSLIRLYTDNLSITVKRVGYKRYFVGNLFVLILLTLLFQIDFLQIQWVGSLVILLMFTCALYVILKESKALAEIG